MREDKELEQYRRLMSPPSTFIDGFNLKSVIGCIFIGLVMMPASMYLSLLAGGNLGEAARWVTVILFVELARRSFTTLKRPEIFILFYMAGAAVASPFSGLLWNQFYATSEGAKANGLFGLFPSWYAPGPEVLAQRTFFHRAWLVPILLVVGQNLLSRIDNFGLGYVLFRITSDVERLPFPMAPVGALGITALAESSSGTATWRWRVFSIGGMIGLLFGTIFLGVPAITGTFLKQPIQPLPITFVDLTTNTQNILPAVPMGLSLDLGNVLLGMVLPFYAVLGSFLGMIATWIANPILHAYGQLPGWHLGMDGLSTDFQNYIDVYMSVGIGLSAAIALIGFYHVFSSLHQARNRVAVLPVKNSPIATASASTVVSPYAAATAGSGSGESDDMTPPEPQRTAWQRLTQPPPTRGDFPIWIGIAIYLFSTLTYVTACRYLVPTFPLWILIGYGFVYTPIISYVAARMEGIAGQWVDIPMVREATFILSQRFGYKGIDIWFAPIPLQNYAGTVKNFRTQELTGTKFTSIIKAELIIFPVVMVSSILFSQYLWRVAPIPSAVYPYAQQFWALTAQKQAIMHSSTLGNRSVFYDAIKWQYICGAGGIGVVVYSALSSFGAPIMLSYGLVRGLGSGLAQGMIPQMIGALIGRYYFRKRFGAEWSQYAPVLFAGFSCGMGLISMFSLGCVLISKAVFQLPF